VNLRRRGGPWPSAGCNRGQAQVSHHSGKVALSVTAGHLAPTLGESVPSQSRGDTWIRVMGGRIQSFRNGHWLSQRKYVLLTHIENHSGGNPLVIAPWLTNHNRDLDTSPGLVNLRAGPQLRA